MTSGGERALVSARTFVADWDRWHAKRRAEVLAPTGPASLAHTAWLDDEFAAVPDAPGEWARDGGAVLGREIGWSGYRSGDGDIVTGETRLEPGEELSDGTRTLRAHARRDERALRVFDAGRPAREGIVGIDAYPPESRWVVSADFRPVPGRVVVDHVDGSTSEHAEAGIAVFLLDGHEIALEVRVGERGLSAVFADSGSGGAHNAFRFLSLPSPDRTGRTLVDFNRATLPPCAFSDQFACPLPSAANRLPVNVAAGERAPRRKRD
ncbi:DUF1684 domain-containing protein [Pseudoclavibacter chungangensis]|uniref:DUF1684 domain-containing protein n=1 Tax=Pseudoclavibacter chungangensis TaxID=587635 RepID=A0A7J5C0V3_9MICO|nr:DUF1684 domain-containing protein [Pseudoclavibacter chungangensis]KAB1662249.1 DUF1684 domain-containing protein [Pseudoclavibacter chungangensis]NYJ65454.1 hypothetical protein [Pseudoclavibacter chungangensis]